MGTTETKIMIAVGMKLLKKLFAPDRPDTGLTDKIVAAKTKREVREAVNLELTELIVEAVDIQDYEAELLVEALVAADSTEAVEAAIEQPKVQKGIIEAIAGLLQGLARLIFG